VILFNGEVRTIHAFLDILFGLNLYIEVSKRDVHAIIVGVMPLENDYLQ
jgi:hypothetical protein